MTDKPEKFVVFVREDEMSADIMADEVFLREVMYHVWSIKVDDEGGVVVSDKDEISIDKVDVIPGFPDTITGIRAAGLARRK